MCIKRGLSHAFPDKREALFPACILNSKLFLFDNHFPEKIEPGAFVKINFRARTKKIHSERKISVKQNFYENIFQLSTSFDVF